MKSLQEFKESLPVKKTISIFVDLKNEMYKQIIKGTSLYLLFLLFFMLSYLTKKYLNIDLISVFKTFSLH